MDESGVEQPGQWTWDKRGYWHPLVRALQTAPPSYTVHRSCLSLTRNCEREIQKSISSRRVWHEPRAVNEPMRQRRDNKTFEDLYILIFLVRLRPHIFSPATCGRLIR